MKNLFIPSNFAFSRLQLTLFFSLCFFQFSSAQNLSIKDFAIWGGSSPASTFNAGQGVVINKQVTLIGNIGTNHQIDAREKLILTGNIFSGNGIKLDKFSLVTGNLFALKSSSGFLGKAIDGPEFSTFKGNLTANGVIEFKKTFGQNSSFIKGKVAVPAPSSVNYKGPTPTGGIVNTVTLPVLPVMPNISAFDNMAGTTKINSTRTISPGAYGKLELKNNQTLTFDGPGNYIFSDVDCFSTNNLLFDFKNTLTGVINIYIVGDAKFGTVVVRTRNGNPASRIFTEIHGTGVNNNGFAFNADIVGSLKLGECVWFGNIWAPNGGIRFNKAKTSLVPHIIGALWSGVKVDLGDNLSVVYSAPPASVLTFVNPYYPPPAQGKVDAPNNTIGSELLSLTQNTSVVTSIPDNTIYKLDNAGNVKIEVISKVPNDNVLKGQLIALGMTDIANNGPDTYTITGFFPINILPQLNGNDRIAYVRPWYPPINNIGQVTTQGDKTMRSNMVRELYGIDGTGIKIGVMSDSYNSKLAAQSDVDQGDLPGLKTDGLPNPTNGVPVQVVQDLSQSGNDEGRAMLQIVHDIAPKSTLAFRTGFISAGDFARGIKELADPNLPGGRCDIIVDDLTYITEPFLKDGVVAKVVDEVVGQGVTYFTSAGNFGQRSYEGVFNGVSKPAVVPSPAEIHKFGATSSDIYQSIQLKPGSYTIVLQWDDEFQSLGGTGGVQTDMDLYLVGANGFTLFGFNRSNLFKDPFEVCPFTVTEETVAKLMIVRAAGTANVRFKYIIFRGDATILDYKTGTSTVVGHANANGAISVGAMFYENRPGVTPIWPAVASFSSRGGTFTKQNNAFSTRNKPDLIAPNGVNTTVNLGGAFFDDGDQYPNFFGTSAAAPHAAAIGALIAQSRKKFNLQTTVTPEQIRQQLIASAGRFSYLPASGHSFEGGFGFIQADSAIGTVANPKPQVDSLILSVGGTRALGAPSVTQPYTIILKGSYLASNSQVLVNGLPLVTTVSANKTEASASVNPLSAGYNPSFQVINPAKSASGLDGGVSAPIFFNNNIRKVLIKAVNKNRKYGEQNPTFEAAITINGVPINQTDVTLSQLKLDQADALTFSNIATNQSKAGLYGIFVERTIPLEITDPVSTQFNFIFESGTLNVQKMPLKITPEDKTIKYGEYPGDISYRYDFEFGTNTEGIVDSAKVAFLEEIKRLHKEYMADNGVMVVPDFGNQESIGSGDLLNLSALASFQSVLNAKKYILENGQLKALVNEITPEEIGNQRFILETQVQSLLDYNTDSANAYLNSSESGDYSGLLNLKALANGTAKAGLPEAPLVPMINGQLMAMVNGQLKAIVNGQLKAIVNGEEIDVADIVFQNGQLKALVNGEYLTITNGQLKALVNGVDITVDLSVLNGQLKAIVNGEEMQLLNGQLKAIVNGQELSLVNGQLRALVNGQLMPIVNGQLMAIVNGQLKALVNGQLVAIVNGQLMALVNGELETVTELTLVNGQLKALVNGQLKALVNGQLKAMVNGVVTDIDNTSLTLVNGQLKALVNGQLKALVNGQLKALVNAEGIAAEKVIQLANGQLKAIVNGVNIPIANGQLKALVNGQLMAMVNGQLMALVNNEIVFTIFQNGQLKALVNGQLQSIVNGQLKAIVNGNLQEVNSYTIANGQLKAIVNGEEWVYPNGQLKALVNGQLKALVNNFDVSGENNNAKTMVLVNQNDLILQGGDIGGMFSMAMVTGKNAGTHSIIPGAFINENFELTYGIGTLEILPTPLSIKANDKTRAYGDDNPDFDLKYDGIAYEESVYGVFGESNPVGFSNADINSGVGIYPINIESYGSNDNYVLALEPGTLTITKKTLTVTADDIQVQQGVEFDPALFTVSYDSLVGDDTEDSVCVNFITPASPKVINELERTSTYSNIKINGTSNVFYASPGQTLTLTGNRYTTFNFSTNPYCPGCITQLYIGMGNESGGNVFADCSDASGMSTWNQDLNREFNAPLTPGIYYITQITTWWYYCDQFGAPVHNNNVNAIAVVIVTKEAAQANKITAGVSIKNFSNFGEFPITLNGCANYNPNYDVVLKNGILTITGGQAAAQHADDEMPAPRIAAKVAPKKIITQNVLYPNPASSSFRLELTKDAINMSSIQVIDALGKISKVNCRKVDNGIYDFNISGLAKGLYFLQVRTAEGIKLFKFVKI